MSTFGLLGPKNKNHVTPVRRLGLFLLGHWQRIIVASGTTAVGEPQQFLRNRDNRLCEHWPIRASLSDQEGALLFRLLVGKMYRRHLVT